MKGNRPAERASAERSEPNSAAVGRSALRVGLAIVFSKDTCGNFCGPASVIGAPLPEIVFAERGLAFSGAEIAPQKNMTIARTKLAFKFLNEALSGKIRRLHRFAGFRATKTKANAHNCASQCAACATGAGHAAAKSGRGLGQEFALNSLCFSKRDDDTFGAIEARGKKVFGVFSNVRCKVWFQLRPL